jgi:hypothetical protein
MANKAFYVKKLQNGNELCLVIGYVEKELAHVFQRNPETMQQVPNTEMTLPKQKAAEYYLLKN